MIHKTFLCNLYLCIHPGYFLDIVDINKPDVLGSITFVIDDLSELFLQP